MKTYEFKSFEALYMSEAAGKYEILNIVNDNGWIESDLMTECKSWETAVLSALRCNQRRHRRTGRRRKNPV